MEYKHFNFIVNDFEVNARFSKSEINEVWLPILKRIDKESKNKKRFIVFLVAPPATGKSTIAKLLETLGNQHGIPIQALGLDGFHYDQSYLNTHYVNKNHQKCCLSSMKGSPETYDVDKLKKAIETNEVYWPRYSRLLHDVIEEDIEVNSPILFIEGNWLLLNEKPWNELQPDFTIFIKAKATQLKNRLIERKIKGGLTKKEATLFVEQSDLLNIDYVLNHSRKADIELTLTEDFGYILND